uniref:Uncharacterized protein n=1 Tax=Anopheles albimanus TaxID=7167 RepID=A0A182FX40_ANOAL
MQMFIDVCCERNLLNRSEGREQNKRQFKRLAVFHYSCAQDKTKEKKTNKQPNKIYI